MIKTITLDGLTSVTIKQSAYDMARFCWVNNRSGSDIFMSCTDPQCTENADGVKHIPAGEHGMLDTESYETLYIKGSGMVNIETSPFAVCPFGEGKKGGGASLSGSASYTISNAVDYPLLGLNLYGKSVQDGVPSPENPVEIVSVVEPTVNIEIPCIYDNFNLGYISNSLGLIENKFWRVNAEYIKTNGAKKVSVDIQLSNVIRNYLTFCDKNGGYISKVELSNNGKSYIDIPDNSSIEGFYFSVNKVSFETDWNNHIIINLVKHTLTLSNTLNAIPVSSGGNVTIDGQGYIADYKDYGAGKYHRLVDPDKLDPTVSIVDNLELQLASEEITDIPETEMQAYRQLQTYNGVTNISNDKGAGLSVEYCTNKMLSECVLPITTGLQKQIDELQAAILSLGSNI